MPTECNAESISFTPLANRAVAAAFDAGAISSDGGVLLLREVDRKVNLLGRASAAIPDPRTSTTRPSCATTW